MMGGAGITLLILSDSCKRCWCCRVMFPRGGRKGWQVTSRGDPVLSVSLTRGCRQSTLCLIIACWMAFSTSASWYSPSSVDVVSISLFFFSGSVMREFVSIVFALYT